MSATDGIRERIEEICHSFCFDRYSPNTEKGIADLAALVAEARREALQGIRDRVDSSRQFLSPEYSKADLIRLTEKQIDGVLAEIDRLSSVTEEEDGR